MRRASPCRSGAGPPQRSSRRRGSTRSASPCRSPGGLELVQWAERRGAFLIEDDYDSEYRYRGSPLPALFSLKPAAPVVYLGSFSKTMSPSMRLGYLIVPEVLASRLHRLMAEVGAKASIVPQPALAQFMGEGHYGAHIRRTRRAYARRQAVLLAALDAQARGLLRAEAEPSGMHVIADILDPRLSDREAAGRAEASGITARALSSFYSGEATRQGLVLGYAGFAEDAIEAGVKTLVRALGMTRVEKRAGARKSSARTAASFRAPCARRPLLIRPSTPGDGRISPSDATSDFHVVDETPCTGGLRPPAECW